MQVSDSALLDSLRSTLNPNAAQKGDVRFQFGTEMGSNYVKYPMSGYNVYKPLPTKFGQPEPGILARPHVVHPRVNPRLKAYADEVKAVLVPVHAQLTESLKRLDVQDCGYVNMEIIETGLKETGVFLSKEDVSALVELAPRNVKGELDYFALLDAIVDKDNASLKGSSLSTSQSPTLPLQFEWSGEEPLTVGLRLHHTTEPFEVPAASMKRYARELTDIRRREQNPEKVANLIRHFLLQDLLISPGRPGHPELAFRQWLMYNGIMARTLTTSPGVIPPEVYEVFNQIISALGVPSVTSATMTATDMGASLRHTTRLGPVPP